MVAQRVRRRPPALTDGLAIEEAGLSVGVDAQPPSSSSTSRRRPPFLMQSCFDEETLVLPDDVSRRNMIEAHRQSCSEVLPRSLYFGGQRAADNPVELSKVGVTHLVNLTDSADESRAGHMEHFVWPLSDHRTEDIVTNLPLVITWIDRVILSGGVVFVHCKEGVSRSSAVVVAYLMFKFRIPFEDALARVKCSRPSACPNLGFTKQLIALEVRMGLGAPSPAPASERRVWRIVVPDGDDRSLLRVQPLDHGFTADLDSSAVITEHDGVGEIWVGHRCPLPYTWCIGAGCRYLESLGVVEGRSIALPVVAFAQAMGRVHTGYDSSVQYLGSDSNIVPAIPSGACPVAQCC